MDKTIIFIIGAVVLCGAGFWLFQSGIITPPSPVVATPLPQGIVLFYGKECPHCIKVEDYVTQNKVEDKVKFSRLEVWHDAKNAALLGNVAKDICKLNVGDGVAVPFLYDGNGKCLVGDEDVINFFKEKAGIK